MSGSNLKDPKNNDLASSFPAPSFGDPAKSESESDRLTPGVGLEPADDQSTPQAKRAGYGYSANKGGSAMGGHNMDSRNQYTVRVPRGSSL
jgi:hypothetical protein